MLLRDAATLPFGMGGGRGGLGRRPAGGGSEVAATPTPPSPTRAVSTVDKLQHPPAPFKSDLPPIKPARLPSTPFIK